MRPLRDRLAELMRRARLNGVGGHYLDQSETTQEEWRQSADRMLKEAAIANIEIREAS